MSDSPMRADGPAATVVFSEKLVASQGFKTLFREGMGLVEQTAAYLDGPGRVDSKALGREAALAYATESMRLTTRLMQLASWLLLQRAVNEGEMSAEQAGNEKNRVSMQAAPEPDAEIAAMLPDPLSALIHQSIRLHARIRVLEDTKDQAGSAAEPDNAVGRQIDRLRQAFPTS